MHHLRNFFNKKSVLLVEDNKSMCRLLTKILEKTYDVHPFVSAVEAINWLSKSEKLPDYIVSDIVMDDMNGVEFNRYLKMSGIYESIPFIFISGMDSEQIKTTLMTADYDAFVQKPFRPDLLISQIQDAAEEKFEIA